MPALVSVFRPAGYDRFAAPFFVGYTLNGPQIHKIVAVYDAAAVIAPGCAIRSALALAEPDHASHFAFGVARLPPYHARADERMLVYLLKTYEGIAGSIYGHRGLDVIRSFVSNETRL